MSTGSGPLTGRRIVITGAAGGIGLTLARRCVGDGAAVALVDADPRVLELASELGGVGFAVDITDRSTAPSTLAEAAAQLGGVDGLANVAGAQRDGDAVHTTDEVWDLVLAVNLTAPWVWSRAAIPHMLKAGRGSIVNVASIAASHALPSAVSYVTSKTGLLGLTRSIAVDFGRQGIRCNSVSPGTIETDFFRDYARRNPDVARRLEDLNFAGRFGTADEVAACCAYLLGDESGFVNGTDVAIDGGRAAASVVPRDG
ncbi:SDR family oxidoreductase [Baekduia soli]|uniref:SDR family oxidoreductase n=1 Tax=Baekduia soli TaxID=496014 RepID=A0A5B8TZG9_9ACTN|nr:SDR family oxidoreductase [Baekduia soli]QEC46118.1 SDR family oxidoreductase [Baekduia soli]